MQSLTLVAGRGRRESSRGGEKPSVAEARVTRIWEPPWLWLPQDAAGAAAEADGGSI